MPRTKCPTVRSGGTTSVRSALMPMVMTSRASMEWSDLAFWRAKQQRHHSGARGARARNPYSRSWLWIPRCAIAHLRPAPSGASRNDERNLLLRSSRAFNERLATLHLVGQRGFVDLDHDSIGLDAEVLHQRLRDVAHHAGLLFVGTAGGHAHGNFRHILSPFSLATNTTSALHHEAQASHLAHSSSPAKAGDPVFRAASVQLGVTAYWTPAGACRRDRRRRGPMAGMTI